MKKFTIFPVFLLLLSLAFSQDNLTDQGMTSDVHKQYVGKLVFSNTPVAFQKEDPATFKNKFNWGEPIYSRVYLPHGLAFYYQKLGWDYSYKTRYTMELAANGNVIASMYLPLDKTWTTFQPCFYPAEGDNRKFPQIGMIWNNLDKLNPGDNQIVVSIYPALNNMKGDLICSGSFTLNIPSDLVKQASVVTLTGIKTRWSGDDAWKEWNISLNNKSGSMKTRWSGDDAWKEWKFELPEIAGTIKTRWSGDDAWKEWVMNDGTQKIYMKTRWSGDGAWKEWKIKGTSELTIKTRFSGDDDGWKDWVITGPKGKMNIKTRWSGGEGAWKDWVIKDEMPDEDLSLKYAAVFTCLIPGAVLR